jgi:hypothetical protein
MCEMQQITLKQLDDVFVRRAVVGMLKRDGQPHAARRRFAVCRACRANASCDAAPRPSRRKARSVA